MMSQLNFLQRNNKISNIRITAAYRRPGAEALVKILKGGSIISTFFLSVFFSVELICS